MSCKKELLQQALNYFELNGEQNTNVIPLNFLSLKEKRQSHNDKNSIDRGTMKLSSNKQKIVILFMTN